MSDEDRDELYERLWAEHDEAVRWHQLLDACLATCITITLVVIMVLGLYRFWLEGS